MSDTELYFSYEMVSSFSVYITRHSFKLMCLPRDTLRQHVTELNTSVSPYTWISEGEDQFKNRYIYGEARDHHNDFAVRVTGRARTVNAAAEESADKFSELFLCRTPQTEPGAALRGFYDNIRQGATGGAYERAVCFMNRLHAYFIYESGSTDIYTTSEAALAGGRGVCQDYAHILISLCRLDGIPARYTAGMMLGEGETHAWIEVLDGGIWRGLDPTHNRAVDGTYIKLSHGRDCRDCLVNRGIFFNRAYETQTVRANVAIEKQLRR